MKNPLMNARTSTAMNVDTKIGTITCPRCMQHKNLRRSRRRGFEKILSSLRVFPFRCEGCFLRFRKFILSGDVARSTGFGNPDNGMPA